MVDTIEDELPKSKLKTEVLRMSSNCCCICQTPFIHVHHLDFDKKNNILDNLAPLCPNHHTLAHSKSNMCLNLTAERIKVIRHKWYEYVENRRETFGIDLKIGMLKVKNFYASRVDFKEHAQHSWNDMFSSLDPEYRKMSPLEIIDRVFCDSNHDRLKEYLKTMKTMYSHILGNEGIKQEFIEVCNAFGYEFDGKNVL